MEVAILHDVLMYTGWRRREYSSQQWGLIVTLGFLKLFGDRHLRLTYSQTDVESHIHTLTLTHRLTYFYVGSLTLLITYLHADIDSHIHILT
jgi:hypothetical protein